MKKNDFVMGDKISIHNSAIGAVGSGAINYGNVTSKSPDYDYGVILEEIKKLKEALYTIPQNDAQIVALSDIIHAEQAAVTRDGSTMAKYLKKLGGWVLDLAKEVGVNVISGMIGK